MTVTRARATDPWTSWAAAHSVGDLRPRQAAVLHLFTVYGPLSLSQLVGHYEAAIRRGVAPGGCPALPRQSPSGVRTRAKELVDLRYLENTGRTRKNETGRTERLLAVTARDTLFG